MSKGPGRWQRAIMSTLEKYPAFFARDLLPVEPTRAEQAALQRAICTLHDQGKIGLARWWGRNPAGGRVVVFRAATLAPPPHEIVRLECNGDERAPTFAQFAFDRCRYDICGDGLKIFGA